MSKKIVVVNAGPRKGWNTDTLLTEAAKGAESAGVEIVRFDLFRLEKYTYLNLVGNYQQTMNHFVGPTEVFVSGDTLQLKDYSKTDWQWTMFNPEEKQKRHDAVFPEECRKAYEMGAELAVK